MVTAAPSTGTLPAQIHGRVLDLDAHVMFDHDVVAELLGPRFGEGLVKWMAPLLSGVTAEHRAQARERALTDVGSVRGFLALGAVDVGDRLMALDQLGIARQLVLPPVSWPTLDDDRPGAAQSRHRYNEWMAQWALPTDRLIPTALLALHDPLVAAAEADTIARAGFRAVEVPFASPPGGRSPGDSSWDPLWARLAEAGIAVVLHLGAAGAGAAVPAPRTFLDPGWCRIDHLAQKPFPAAMEQFRENADAGPVSLATLHIPAEVFCTSLVLGGVLERHPGLRVVVLEMGAQWVGSWVERLDAVAGTYTTFGLRALGLLPSEMIRRQVRVVPFVRNDVAGWIERDGLGEVYAFASDFPHAEGGRDPVNQLGRSLARLGDDAIERFFVTNASAVLG